MKSEGLDGFLDLVYLPPNNWENREKSELILNVVWPDSDRWQIQKLTRINYGQRIRFETEALKDSLKSDVCFIYPIKMELPNHLQQLPTEKSLVSRVPEWRVTTGFRNKKAQTSYQAEIFPFPKQASLLTFHPFIQYGNVENRLLVLNLSDNPQVIESVIDLFDSFSGEKLGSETVRTNSLTTIYLDKYDFKPCQLPIFYAPNMAGVPFGLGISNDGSMLSLEHTHPPASLVLFGNRNAIQGQVKKKWANFLLGTSQ